MFLKRLKLTNYRKFSSEKNIVEFISSKIVLNQDNDDINDNFEENSVLFPEKLLQIFLCIETIPVHSQQR